MKAVSPAPMGKKHLGSFRDESVDTTRDEALLITSVEQVQRLDNKSLLTLQRVLQHGDRFGVWLTPPMWLPPSKGAALHTIDLRRRIVDNLPEAVAQNVLGATGSMSAKGEEHLTLVDHAVRVLVRYLILLRIGPAGLGPRIGYHPLDPSSVATTAYWIGPLMLARAIENTAAAPGFDSQEQADAALLGTLHYSNLAAFSSAARNLVLTESKRMRQLAEMDLWSDVPDMAKSSLPEAMIAPAHSNPAPKKRDSHLPLPDDYVAEMGRKSLWLARVLAPNVLAIAGKMCDLWAVTVDSKLPPDVVADRRLTGTYDIVAAHEWLDRDGEPIEAPPFSILLPRPIGFGVRQKEEDDDNEDSLRWPPSNYRDIMALLGRIQLAHFFIVALSMGARQSESLRLQRDCVVRAPDNRPYANGKTYKLVQRHDGDMRDWLLPDVAVDAIEQQACLVAVAERLTEVTPNGKSSASLENGHLWAQISAAAHGDATRPLTNINKALRSYARAIQMSTMPGGQNLRTHRFRKTLARLVALALTQAPKLLMDVFGHKSIEMTLYYILGDKDLRAEIETVSRELRVMRAKTVVEEMVKADLMSKDEAALNHGGYGGLAAVSIHDTITRRRHLIHRRGNEWGAENNIELAELLTLQGKAWEQVRRGVICTKLPGEAGPCNKRKGRPEPSKCSSACTHRLEEAFLREDVDASIREAVTAFEQSVANEEQLIAAHWAAQMRANVPRFPDLRAKWMQNPTVAGLMAAPHDDEVTG